MKTIDRKTLVKALRCVNTPGSGCRIENCPYFVHVGKDDPDRIEFENNNCVMPEDFWEGCDFERMTNDDIELLETEEENEDQSCT